MWHPDLSPIGRLSPSTYFLCMDVGVALGPMLMGGLVYYAAVPGTRARRAGG